MTRPNIIFTQSVIHASYKPNIWSQ